MHCKKTLSLEVVVEHDAVRVLLFIYQLLDNGLFSVELDLRMFLCSRKGLKMLTFENRFSFQSNEILFPSL